VSGLPAGWEWSTVGEIAATSLGKMLDAKQATGQHSTPYLRNINVRWGHFDLDDVASMDIRPEELERVLAQPGDIIVCEGGEPGRAAVWRGPNRVALQKALHKVRPNGAVAPDFLALSLRHQAGSGELAALFTGTTIRHLPQEKLRLVRVPLPPRTEQERIVVAIEEAFSKLDAGEAGLQACRQRLKRMRAAVLAAAVTGRLVHQDPTDTPATKLLADLGVERASERPLALPDGWAFASVSDIAIVGSGTTPKRGREDYWLGGSIPWVTSGALNAGVVREASEYVTDAALRETSLRLWPAGTLLVAMYGEGQTRGRCAELAIEATCNQACAAISVRDGLDDFRPILRLHFDANYSANRRLAAGGVQPNLSGALIKAMIVALPPPGEAIRIVAEVERQMSFLEACERAVEAGLERSAALRRSVLKAAFEGHLVPQDPSDEPASVLLERIRAERTASPKAARPSRRTA
jgi:type I restriction enzyme S subunit